MIFIGDVHAEFDWLEDFLLHLDKWDLTTPVIQVGDLGIGFPEILNVSTGQFFKREPDTFPDRFYFIRGNHDNPEACRKYPNYLGDFGYNEKLGLFYISGAESYDKDHRTFGVDWWNDEELSYPQFMECMELFNKIKPKIVVSHDCPACIIPPIWKGHGGVRTRTEKALEFMWTEHQPEVWVFGHWHTNTEVNIKGTRFICLNSKRSIRIDNGDKQEIITSTV